jgi:tetratricopeptide (TPR) repeat protein
LERENLPKGKDFNDQPMKGEKLPNDKDFNDQPTREYLSKRLYNGWISATYYSFAITLIVIFFLVLRVSFTVNQEQLTAFASTAGIFAGLAVSPLIPQKSPNDFGRRSFLLLALTFVLATILILAAKIEIGQEARVTFYIVSLFIFLVGSVATPSVRKRIRKLEFYVEIVFVALPLILTVDFLTTGLIMFILGSLQLVWLLILASSGTFTQSDNKVRQETRENAKVAIQDLLEKNLAKAFSFDEIIKALANKELSLSPSSLGTILEEMNQETLPTKPRLAQINGSYVPIWKETYFEKIKNSLKLVMLANAGGEGHYNNKELTDQIVKESGISVELISKYVDLDSIRTDYNNLLDNHLELVRAQKNRDLFYNRGVLLFRLGRLEESLKSYDEALKIDPKASGVLNAKGMALFRLGRFEESLKSYDEALKINPGDAKILVDKSENLILTGRIEEGLEMAVNAAANSGSVSWNSHNKAVALLLAIFANMLLGKTDESNSKILALTSFVKEAGIPATSPNYDFSLIEKAVEKQFSEADKTKMLSLIALLKRQSTSQ